MSTRTGFPRMDWDTGFLADPKFIHLRDLCPDPIAFAYAGFSFLRLAADAWRTCERHTIAAVVRGIDAVTVDKLQEAELLDSETKIPVATFDKWIGSALKGRQAQADKQARHRQSPGSHRQSPEVTQSLGPVGQVETVGEVGPPTDDDETDLFAFIAKRGAFIRPEAAFGQRLLGLVDRRGVERVMETARELYTGEPMSDRQWVFGLEAALEAIPSPPMAALPEGPTPAEATRRRSLEKAAERRLEYFALTGKWDPAFGPEPEWKAEWGQRPKAAA